MQKKILTLLVLLMTAVTGAWATDYYVVGTMTGWQKNDQYKMTLNASAATTEYQLGIALAATDEFKVIGVDGGDNPWVWYPSGDNYGHNGELTADGLYTIYFRPNGDGGSDWFYNCIYVADGVNLTADGEAWTLAQMPACDVELEVEYYPLATLATTPAAAEGVVEGTDAALLTPGTSAEGTLAYAIGTSEAPTGQWSDAIPTAQDLAAGTCYVWYKVVGDAEHSDSQPQSIAVTIAAAPTYAVTIDDGNVDASKWEAPTEPQKAGETVTLKYNGKKKIRSITIEKAAAEPAALNLTSPAVGQVIGDDGKNYDYASLPGGVTAVAKICYVSGSNGLALALTDEGKMDWSTAQTVCAAHTAPFTGGTWKLATKDEWSNMISAAGSYSALHDGFSSVGGTNMQEDFYWSSTEYDSDFAWYYDGYNEEDWDNGDKVYDLYVRACLAW